MKQSSRNKTPNSKKILLGVTGSISAYKSADIIRRLQESGFMVSVIMTSEAEKFISSLTLSSLCCEKVYRDMFAEDNAWMAHITLAKEADLFLIAPATANVIAKLAHGIADDLLTTTFLATRAKLFVAPAMNDQMWQHKIVQENIKKLKSIGANFINPIEGSLACGTFGEGHLADVDQIVKVVEKAV